MVYKGQRVNLHDNRSYYFISSMPPLQWRHQTLSLSLSLSESNNRYPVKDKVVRYTSCCLYCMHSSTNSLLKILPYQTTCGHRIQTSDKQQYFEWCIVLSCCNNPYMQNQSILCCTYFACALSVNHVLYQVVIKTCTRSVNELCAVLSYNNLYVQYQ
jgi:hypothetical protein